MELRNMRTLVIGDVHGNIKALEQCLKRSNFDYENDKLICLGDVCDGFEWTKECFDEILKIKNLVYILGNHDWWVMQYYSGKMVDSHEQYLWTSQGGKNTLKSYGHQMIHKEHLDLLLNAKLYHLEYHYDEVSLFVHAGIIPQKKLEDHDDDVLLWDRELVFNAKKKHNQRPNAKYGNYENIFVGHTTTELFKSVKPLHHCNIWMIDTGAGWNGKLTIMDINTKKYWQSDLATELYQNVDNGRK